MFRNKSSMVDEVADSIVWTVSEWASCDMEFSGVPSMLCCFLGKIAFMVEERGVLSFIPLGSALQMVSLS